MSLSMFLYLRRQRSFSSIPAPVFPAVVLVCLCPGIRILQPEESEEGDTDESEALSSRRRYGVNGGGGEEERQRQRRRRLAGGVREAGVAMGVADDGNNQDRKLCEVNTLKTAEFIGDTYSPFRDPEIAFKNVFVWVYLGLFGKTVKSGSIKVY